MPAAERAYRAVLASAPRHFGALQLLGLLKAQQRQFSEAYRLLSKALDLEPGSVAALSTLAGVLVALGRESEALAACDRILAQQPNDVDTHYNRGLVLVRLGRLAEALAAYDRALALKPDLPVALLNRANVLAELERYDEAIAAFDRLLARNAGNAEAHNNRGLALFGAGRHAEALASYDRALAIRPDYAEAHNNRGWLLHRLNRHDEALAAYDRALAIRPDYADASNNRGLALHEVHRHAEALASYARTLAIRPDFAEARFNQSLTQLCVGDLRSGWPNYEWRWKTKKSTAPWRDFREPLWLGGESLEGRTILLHAEQGFGDTLHFARYIPQVARRGARVVLELQPALIALLAELDGVSATVERGAPLPAFDCHCPLGSLPLAFATELATIPAAVPYLPTDPARVAHWAARLPDGRPNVGIVWCGNPNFRGDYNRSMTFAQFSAVVAKRDVAFVTLNPGLTAEDASALADHADVLPFARDLRDFADTAALVASLDLVITTDTAVAHLAGALGRPVWLLLSASPDWRWFLDREDCPWYPSARLLRQSALGEWDPVIARVGRELEKFIATRGARS